MGCDAKIESDSYDFFEDIEKYINKANGAKNNDASGEISAKCDNFSKAWETSFKNKQIAKNVCEELIKLYKNLNNLKAESRSSKDHKNECGFFNYRVNLKIAESRSNEHKCVSYIYNGIESQFLDCDFYNMFELDVIYDINKDELDKMNKLYNLYEMYTKLNSIIVAKSEQDKQKLLTLSTQCCRDYNEASYICNPENNINNNNSKFCQELNKFESKYNELDGKVREQASELSDYFIRLSECPNTKIITTAVTGSIIGLIPLFGVLYKFTPMGQVIRSKIGIINNDEEMTKMSLMEQENEPLRFKQGTYNIKYQSL